MKKLSLLLLTLLLATTSLANTRNWKIGKIDVTSESNVSWKLWGEKSTMHYTIETEDLICLADCSYKPSQNSDHHAPRIVLNQPTKIAIEGKHAYVLDVTGKEVKLHIVKKTKK